MAPVREQTPRSGAPFRITALYVAFGATWVLVGDVGLLRPGLLTQHSWFLNLAKGLFFVAASALFLFYLLRRETAAAQQAQQAQRRLQRMDAVSRLAGGIAHEFNNLMTTVLGNAALLTETLPDGDARRAHAEQVRAAAGRAASLTRQLLTFSGRDVVRPTEVDVGALVAELAPVVVRMAGSDVRTRVSAQPGRHVTEADYGQLKQLILSLVVNAVEAMPDGGELTLEVAAGSSPARETAAGRDSVVIRCSDTGRGMDDQTMELIFEPFFSTKPQGAGLGLSTVHGIVQHAGGHVAVSSQPGRGTIFTIHLPAMSAEARPTPAGPAPPHAASATVLVAEDDDAVRELTCRILRSRGFTVLDAPTGEAALAIGTSHDVVDVLVADVLMPGMTGIELAERLTAHRPGLHVLLMSGFTGGLLADGSSMVSEFAFLEKPFEPDELSGRIRQLLESPATEPTSTCGV
jgi:two-component system, cell cycle sensor histidine kinase and response regulator CckA